VGELTMAKKAKVTFREPSVSAIEDAWQREATRAAIAAAKDVACGTIPPATPIGRLSDTEWGFVVGAVLFGWIQTRAQQASAEGLEIEATIRNTGIVPDPWNAGAVIAVLPDVAEACHDLDFSQPLGAWSKEDMARLLLEALRLVTSSLTSRDRAATRITQEASRASTLNDGIPF
jgi:hypothetical protein